MEASVPPLLARAGERRACATPRASTAWSRASRRATVGRAPAAGAAVRAARSLRPAGYRQPTAKPVTANEAYRGSNPNLSTAFERSQPVHGDPDRHAAAPSAPRYHSRHGCSELHARRRTRGARPLARRRASGYRRQEPALEAMARCDRARQREAPRRQCARRRSARAEKARSGAHRPAHAHREERRGDGGGPATRSPRCPTRSARSSDLRYRPSGIQVGQMRVPLGVIGIIYESRPNVTADAAGLCLKSGNAAILRGGSRSAAFEPGDRRLRARGTQGRRAARSRRAGDRDHRPRRRRRADHDAASTST